MSSSVFARATGIKGPGKDYFSIIEVTLEYQADASNNFLAPVINTLPGLAGFDLVGYKLYSVKCWPGATAPTDASDLTITDVNSLDLLGSRGTDLIDETSVTSCCAGTTLTQMPMIITGPIKLTLSNNAVANAITNFKLLFVE